MSLGMFVEQSHGNLIIVGGPTHDQICFAGILDCLPKHTNKSNTMSNQKNVDYRTDWATSEAKDMLKQDIINKRIEGWRPAAVYNDQLRHYLYKQYKYDNFVTNLRNLRKSIETLHKVADRDRIAYRAYANMHPVVDDSGQEGLPHRWHQSNAQYLLRQMVKADTLGNRKPRDIRESNPLFMNYTMQQFRRHLDHEKTRHWKKMNDKEYAERVRFLKATINPE